MLSIKKYKGFIIPLLFLLGILFINIHPADNRNNIPKRLIEETQENPERFADSSTSYIRYKKISDSLQLISQWKKSRISGIGEGWYSLLLGITKINECDSCNSLIIDEATEKKINKVKYFINFRNYTLDNDASFFIEKNKYYIKYSVWDKKTEYGATGHSEIKESAVRFTSDTNEFSKNESALLIPISKKTYTILNILMIVILIPLSIILLFIVFILPIKVLYRIATGQSFVIQNIKNLRLTGWTIIIITVFPLIISWVVKLVLGSQLPKEIYFPGWLYLVDQKGWLIAGTIFLLLSSAFQRGYNLQQEQDLTV